MFAILYKDAEDAQLFTGSEDTGMKSQVYIAVSTQEVVDWQTHMIGEEKTETKGSTQPEYRSI